MSHPSIQLLGLEGKVVLHSANGHDHLERQIIKVTRTIRSYDDRTLPDVLVGRIQTVDMRPTDNTVIIKFSRSSEALASLEHEHRFYNLLAHLQGTAIPKCFGLHNDKDPDSPDQRDLGCLILEHCEETPLYIEPGTSRKHRTSLKAADRDEYVRKLVYGMLQIHHAGVILNHGDMGQIVRQGREPRIIDFSKATMHYCPNAHHALFSASAGVNNRIQGLPACWELFAIDLANKLAQSSEKNVFRSPMTFRRRLRIIGHGVVKGFIVIITTLIRPLTWIL